MTICIITGCILQLEHSTAAVAGDLFVAGDQFIFNGNWKDGETLWLPREALRYKKAIIIPMGYDYFERRGVFVMKASRALLNDEANNYTVREEIPA